MYMWTGLILRPHSAADRSKRNVSIRLATMYVMVLTVYNLKQNMGSPHTPYHLRDLPISHQLMLQ